MNEVVDVILALLGILAVSTLFGIAIGAAIGIMGK